ncbi:MAG: sugar phosphate isomerase/epimerase [Halioglobus sp.]|nr:sugar phosphate isomerase/epimerase [Halioglobus sp.]
MHARISVNTICFMDEAVAQQVAHWPELDSRRFSVIGPQLDKTGEHLVQQALAEGNYALETIVHPFSSVNPLDSDDSILAQARAGLSAQIGVAKRLGAKSIYMTTGGRGSLSWEQAAEAFAMAIAPCVVEARSAGIALMIENAPPQYADLHIAHSLQDALTLAKIADIGVCIDLVGCWTEAGLQNLIEKTLPRCHLVQVSDYCLGDRSLPSRAVPGDGALPLKQLLEWLVDAGYEGAFDLELLGPRIETEGRVAAMRRAVRNLSEMLHEIGVPQ